MCGIFNQFYTFLLKNNFILIHDLYLFFSFLEFIMNPSGKSPVCILHEYVQHTLRVQPKYIFKELGKILSLVKIYNKIFEN